jgi:SHS2 domain-containing protein
MASLEGFREVEHTADWEIEVWAPDFAKLLEQAALGMMWLSGTVIQAGNPVQRTIKVPGEDRESQLVNFLNELLFLGETEALAFDFFQTTVYPERCTVMISGGIIKHQTKAIKAVTFHNLAIRESEAGLKVNLVFDV